MTILWPFTVALAFFLQAAENRFPADVFIPKETTRIEKARNVEGRIKVYQDASKRIQRMLETAIREDEFQDFPGKLNVWNSLLTGSLEDIEANLKTKKKSKALKDYEIQVRKSITDMEKFRIRVPVEQQDTLDTCLAQAERVRKRFMEILFEN
jgi:hypothetical protein